MPRHSLEMEEADAQPAKRVRLAPKRFDAPNPVTTRKARARPKAEPEILFHKFRDLPDELKIMVWNCVPSERRVVRALPHYVILAAQHTNAVNPLLHTCRLSRDTILRRLIEIPRLMERSPKGLTIPVYIDTLWDILDLTHIYRRHRDLTQKAVQIGPSQEEKAEDEKAKDQDAVEKLRRQLGLSTESTTRCIQPLMDNMGTVAVGIDQKWKVFKSRDDDEKTKVLGTLPTIFPKAIRTFIFSNDDISWRWNYNLLFEGGKIRERLLAIMKAKEEKGKNLDEDEKTIVRMNVEEMEDDRTFVQNLGEGIFFVETYNVHNRFKDEPV